MLRTQGYWKQGDVNHPDHDMGDGRLAFPPDQPDTGSIGSPEPVATSHWKPSGSAK